MKLRVAGLLAFAALLLASPARAHLVTTGLGPFYDGITHLAVSPTDLMAVIALALLAGLGGPVRARAVVATLPAAWLAGGLLGLLAGEELLLPLVLALALLVLGVLVAADASLPRSVAALLAAAAGLVFGGLNGTALSAAGNGLLGLVGIVTAATVVLFLLSATAVCATAPWQRIAVRVAGSWIAAIAILMLGWSFAARDGQPATTRSVSRSQVLESVSCSAESPVSSRRHRLQAASSTPLNGQRAGSSDAAVQRTRGALEAALRSSCPGPPLGAQGPRGGPCQCARSASRS